MLYYQSNNREIRQHFAMAEGVQSRNLNASSDGDDDQYPLSSSQFFSKSQSGFSTSSNIFVKFARSVFGYRKTSLSLLFIVSVLLPIFLTFWDNSLDYTVDLPKKKSEQEILENSWTTLENIARYSHPYGSQGNEFVHRFLERRIKEMISSVNYIEFDDELNSTNNIMYNYKPFYSSNVVYYESNNLLVKINGKDPKLPGLLLSAHYDSVPSSYGVTDDGIGVASLLGILQYFTQLDIEQPQRTIIFNFNNNEEFGLSGATAFLNHRWSKEVGYFLNLEGTGAGGKAVLFRGTDYGITKYYQGVRFPFASSFFQQGFNSRLIRSETDYKVYLTEGRFRGLDIAFFRPRDFYHTPRDNIRNVNKKSLWHMLANALDFSKSLSVSVDLDMNEDSTYFHSKDNTVFASFMNYFFVCSTSQLVMVNGALLVGTSVLLFPVLIFVLFKKKSWRITSFDILKFPLSLLFSLVLLPYLTERWIIPLNEFLPNNSWIALLEGYFCLSLLLNYFILNIFGIFDQTFKKRQDDKLVIMVEIWFIYLFGLVYSTINLSENSISNDHSGEWPVTILYLLQSLAVLFGLSGWLFEVPMNKNSHAVMKNISTENESLLLEQNSTDYGSNDNPYGYSVHSPPKSKFSIRPENLPFLDYGWSVQFLIICPFSLLVIFNSGFLILEALNKTIQESLKLETFVFFVLQAVASVLILPIIPFLLKMNRFVVFLLLLVVLKSAVTVYTTKAFDDNNPLKLKFLQTVDVDNKSIFDTINIWGRNISGVSQVLSDLPSVKESRTPINCTVLEDGVQKCSFNTFLRPPIIRDEDDLKNYLQVTILKNSTMHSPPIFGGLSGEVEVSAPTSKMCDLIFNSDPLKQSPVKAVIVYSAESNEVPLSVTELDNTSKKEASLVRTREGDYIFKDLSGINQLESFRLSSEKSLRVGFHWVPEYSLLNGNERLDPSPQLGLQIKCYWNQAQDLTQNVTSSDGSLPAYDELKHFAPNFISLSNKEKGLVSVFKDIEV